MKAIITRQGSERLNIPQGTVIEYDELSKFGNAHPVINGKYLGIISVGIYKDAGAVPEDRYEWFCNKWGDK